MEFNDFDPFAAVEAMSYDGVVSIPSFLKETDRALLLDEVSQGEIVEATKVLGPEKVRQEYWRVDGFPKGSLFLTLQADVERFLSVRFRPYLASPLRFNDLRVHIYEPGPLGLSPHKDGASFINLVALIVLKGRARFGTCLTRDGRGARPFANEPGTLLLMRAPGFLCTDEQPFHFVDNITETRTTVALRQKMGRA